MFVNWSPITYFYVIINVAMEARLTDDKFPSDYQINWWSTSSSSCSRLHDACLLSPTSWSNPGLQLWQQMLPPCWLFWANSLMEEAKITNKTAYLEPSFTDYYDLDKTSFHIHICVFFFFWACPQYTSDYINSHQLPLIFLNLPHLLQMVFSNAWMMCLIILFRDIEGNLDFSEQSEVQTDCSNRNWSSTEVLCTL